MGAAMGENPEIVEEVTGWAKDVATLPVYSKMTPNITDPTVPAEAAVRGGADVVLLDNMTPAVLRSLCPELRALAAELGRAAPELEASGGITEATLADFAASGVDRISMGALTHSAPALDLSLDLAPLRRGEGG